MGKFQKLYEQTFDEDTSSDNTITYLTNQLKKNAKINNQITMAGNLLGMLKVVGINSTTIKKTADELVKLAEKEK